jgi:hypothetical protein
MGSRHAGRGDLWISLGSLAGQRPTNFFKYQCSTTKGSDMKRKFSDFLYKVWGLPYYCVLDLRSHRLVKEFIETEKELLGCL